MSLRPRPSRASTTRACCCYRWSISAASPAITPSASGCPRSSRVSASSTSLNGWINAIPYTVGFLGMIWWGLRSDAKGAHPASRHRAGDRRCRHRRLGLPRRPLSQDGRAHVRLVRRVRRLPIFWTLPTAILGGGTAGGRHCGDQLDRQSLRLFRPVRDGLASRTRPAASHGASSRSPPAQPSPS